MSNVTVVSRNVNRFRTETNEDNTKHIGTRILVLYSNCYRCMMNALFGLHQTHVEARITGNSSEMFATTVLQY